MSILIFEVSDGSSQEYEFAKEVSIGTDNDNGVILPMELSVAPRHAIISRSELYQVPVLVNLANGTFQTRVNRRRVVRLKTLRHRDKIELGQAHLLFWEIIIRKVTLDSPILQYRCMVCYDKFRPGVQVVSCPRCQRPLHKDCWFLSPICPQHACNYPIEETMRRALAHHVQFEELDEDSKLVKEKKTCVVGNKRDQAPFNPHEHIVYCPNKCETSFHIQCWFLLERCPTCSYNVKSLINSIFVPALSKSNTPGGRLVE